MSEEPEDCYDMDQCPHLKTIKALRAENLLLKEALDELIANQVPLADELDRWRTFIQERHYCMGCHSCAKHRDEARAHLSKRGDGR